MLHALQGPWGLMRAWCPAVAFYVEF